MVKWVWVCQSPIVVCKICNGFRCCAEEWGVFDISHGAAEVKPDQDIWVVGSQGYDEGQFGDVLNAYPDTHVGTREVGLTHKHWTKAGVCNDYAVQDARQRTAKLHRIMRGGWRDRPVEAAVGVVVYGAVAPHFLRDARCRQ